MNREQRKEIRKIINDLEIIKNKLSELAEDEQEKYDNLPEGLQDSDRGYDLQDAAETLEGTSDTIDDVVSELEELI